MTYQTNETFLCGMHSFVPTSLLGVFALVMHFLMDIADIAARIWSEYGYCRNLEGFLGRGVI